MAKNLRRQGACLPAHANQCGTTQVLTTEAAPHKDTTLLRLLVSRRGRNHRPFDRGLKLPAPKRMSMCYRERFIHAIYQRSRPRRWHSVLGASRDHRAGGTGRLDHPGSNAGDELAVRTVGIRDRTVADRKGRWVWTSATASSRDVQLGDLVACDSQRLMPEPLSATVRGIDAPAQRASRNGHLHPSTMRAGVKPE